MVDNHCEPFERNQLDFEIAHLQNKSCYVGKPINGETLFKLAYRLHVNLVENKSSR